MPRIFAKEPGAANLVCHYFPLANKPHVLGNAHGFDSDEKWVEIWLFSHHRKADGSARMMTADGRILTARLYINYDIVDKITGETLYIVRQ